MASFNVTKHAFARERKQVTTGGAVTLTQSTYDDVSNQSPSPNTGSRGSTNRKASGARIVLDSGSGDIHFTGDGTTPTAGVTSADVGTIAGERDVILLESYDAITRFKAIALTATNAQLEVEYYR